MRVYLIPEHFRTFLYDSASHPIRSRIISWNPTQELMLQNMGNPGSWHRHCLRPLLVDLDYRNTPRPISQSSL